MRKTALVLFCLTFLGQARRLPSSAEHRQRSSPARTVKLKKADPARATLGPSAAFAALLVANEPAAAFHASSPLAAKWSRNSGRAPLTSMTETESTSSAVISEKSNKTKPAAIMFDSRGYRIPNLGDIVRWPGKWQDEFIYGQVDFLQKIGGKEKTVEAEVIPLEEIGDGLFRVPMKRKRLRMDIKEVTKMKGTYVKEKDAYQLRIPKQVYKPKPVDPEVLARDLAQYAELKAELLKIAAACGAIGTLGAIVRYGPDTAFSFACGSLASLIYLGLLETNVDVFGSGAPIISAVAGLRFLAPAIAFGLLIARQAYVNNGEISFDLASLQNAPLIPKEQLPPLVAGLLTYKGGLALRNFGTIFDDLMREENKTLPIEPDSVGFSGYGMMAKAFKKGLKSSVNEVQQSVTTATPAVVRGQVVAIAGPSEESKRKFIARLLRESPDKYDITVACTTRDPREGEVNGTDFTFLDDEQFTAMVEDNQFIEASKMGDIRFGNSVAAVQAVSTSGKVCLMDLDVKDIPSLKRRSELSTVAIWVPPPTEQGDASSLKALAKESGYFDKLLDSSDSDDAYSILKQTIEGRFSRARR
mmetsp:Transcript_82077/g.145484  ORF Transcript_82077/g.145484 Transcript_82077/m.145484 type:complete len:586 (+) Transcript_82077:13-1770(+)